MNYVYILQSMSHPDQFYTVLQDVAARLNNQTLASRHIREKTSPGACSPITISNVPRPPPLSSATSRAVRVEPSPESGCANPSPPNPLHSLPVSVKPKGRPSFGPGS